jgi:hypothetical protein
MAEIDPQTRPDELWVQSTQNLRGRKDVPAAQANAWLLDQGCEMWSNAVMARTSMHDLLFTRIGDLFPVPLAVVVSWEADVYEFRLIDRWGQMGAMIVSADRCRSANAPVVLDAFLYQLAGVRGPSPGDLHFEARSGEVGE